MSEKLTEEEKKEAKRAYAKAHYEANKEKKKLQYEANKEQIRENQKKNYLDKREERLANQKLYYELHKEEIKQYREDNKDKIKEKSKNYYLNNTDKVKEKAKKWEEQNKEKRKEQSKNWRENNKELINQNYRERRNNDPLFKLACNTRSNIRDSIKRQNYSKKTKTYQILGCSYEELKTYLESKFEAWMTWDNYGTPLNEILEPNKTWDIDHIIPIASATTEEEIIKLNHYTNLQPLCSFHNRKVKRDNY